jgi:hypothetical protein
MDRGINDGDFELSQLTLPACRGIRKVTPSHLCFGSAEDGYGVAPLT